MFLLLLVPLVLQVSMVSCEDPTTTPEYITIDYSEFEVLNHDNRFDSSYYYEVEDTEENSHLDGNSASSTYPSYFNIAALLLFYLICHVLHQDLPGSTGVGRTCVHEGEEAGEICQHQDLPPKFSFSNFGMTIQQPLSV